MTKKEQARMEELLTAAALRTTADVAYDVMLPETGIAFGWSCNVYDGRVWESWSESYRHGRAPYKLGLTGYQGGVRQYSSKLLALKSLRRLTEKECAKKLREIDKQIEAAEEGENIKEG